jgi:hypothetical protein
MSQIDHALRRIDKVLDSHFDPATAYPLRARLGRAVLASSRALASTMVPPPDVEAVLTRLQAAVSHVMQPSEPFDAHWRGQWGDVLDDLKLLRTVLISVSAKSDR